MGREVEQGKMKYLKISCSYVLKSTSYLGLAVSAVGLDLSSPAHAVLPLLVIITWWHNQPHFTLSQQCNTSGLLPFPYPLLSCEALVQWCYECNELYLPNIKGQTRDRPRGLGEGHKPSRETGEDCLAVSPRSKRSGRRPTSEGGKG